MSSLLSLKTPSAKLSGCNFWWECQTMSLLKLETLAPMELPCALVVQRSNKQSSWDPYGSKQTASPSHSDKCFFSNESLGFWFVQSVLKLLLHFQNNRLTKIEGLQSLVNLRELYLSHNGIEAIEGLENNVSRLLLTVTELLPRVAPVSGCAFLEVFVLQLPRLLVESWISWKDHKDPSICYVKIWMNEWILEWRSFRSFWNKLFFHDLGRRSTRCG